MYLYKVCNGGRFDPQLHVKTHIRCVYIKCVMVEDLTHRYKFKHIGGMIFNVPYTILMGVIKHISNVSIYKVCNGGRFDLQIHI